MTEQQLTDCLQPYTGTDRLSAAQTGMFLQYLEVLLKWNAKVNLTSVRNPEEIAARHFGESLFCARQLFPDPSVTGDLADVGSGAGFPGLPIRIWAPLIRVTLIESNQKKATFLREVIRLLNLRHSEVTSRRAEELDLRAHVVSLRAVERFDHIVQVARNLVKVGGRLALLIGESQIEFAKETLPDLRWQQAVPIPESNNRVVVIGNA